MRIAAANPTPSEPGTPEFRSAPIDEKAPDSA